MSKRVAVVMKGYPRLSETFIAQELLGLQQRGIIFDIWSLRHPTDTQTHPTQDAITAPIHYLPEYIRDEPGRVLRAIVSQMGNRLFWRAAAVWLRDLVRARDANRIRRFAQAAVMAHELPDDTAFLYAHFLHTPASVTRYAAIMRGLKWGFSAHAKDIWTTSDWEKREKIADAAFGVTCTGTGTAHLSALAPAEAPDRVALVYHGLDISEMPAPPDRTARSGPLTILSVGRLVEKKGYDLVLQALAALPSSLDWRFVHIGGGELKDKLSNMAQNLDIADKIDWRGAQARDAVLDAMRTADIFILPSRITASLDRDGLPNVLMEAASQKLPVISTSISAIPEFVDTGESGILVPAEDAPALTTAIEALAADPSLRSRYADALYTRLVEDFGSDAGIDAVAMRIRAAMP